MDLLPDASDVTSPSEVWVSTAEAARVLGVSEATVLRRARAGLIKADLEARPQGTQWRICVPAAAITDRAAASPTGADVSDEPSQPSQASELERFAALLDVHMRGYVEREAERDRQLQARSVRIGELQAMLAAAEAGRDQAYADRDAAVAQFQGLAELLNAVTAERDLLKVPWWRRLLGWGR
jgi:hypothetical protein